MKLLSIQNKTSLFYWSLLFIWMGLIFFLSHQSTLPQIPDGLLDTISKKSAHLIAYAILMALWWQSLKTIKPATTPTLLLALVFTLLYAISDEWHQTFIPGRNGQLADVLVDFAGALAVFIIIRKVEMTE